MVARGKLRHHAAVAGVQLRLGVHHVAERTAARALTGRRLYLDHRGSRLVAARFDSQDAHGPDVAVPRARRITGSGRYAHPTFRAWPRWSARRRRTRLSARA